ncbi:MAG: methyltransferase [Marinospirillum sp.]|uniref:methyltransferase n=1 Tax=Marinospirillum sp. TaxID=2183934 RepID=UPI001A0F3ADE|nr:methyltransferase [Marinospirillum sp.]MBE0506916.1 methyltransferase [Marinospirillum sp.]
MPNPPSNSPINQFLFRQRSQWQDQPLNLLAAPAGLNWQDLAADFQHSGQTLQLWTADWRAHQQATRAGIRSFFNAESAPEQLPGRTLVFWPKAKEEGYWWLKQLQTLIPEELLLLGETHGGIKALAKQLQQSGVDIGKMDSARRCALYSVDNLQPAIDLINEHTLIHQWQGPDQLSLISQPGVFSHGRVDEGSALLLQAFAQSSDLLNKGRLLDIGCGCGLLGAWLLQHHPDLQLTACDVSGFALQATRATLSANQLPANPQQQAQVFAADIFTGVESHTPAGGFDLIISNPPFHTGKDTDYELASRLIHQAPEFLKPGGQLWIVANRFLPYPDLLEQAFGSFTSVAENGKFRVYLAIRGKQ